MTDLNVDSYHHWLLAVTLNKLLKLSMYLVFLNNNKNTNSVYLQDYDTGKS